MAGEQKIRSVLFYLSLACFLIGLPFIVSFALGLAFDPATFTFTKTGLISLKTQPQGADVYLNGRLLKEKTPATIYELIPGKYSIKLQLDKYYPWTDSINVDAGRVTMLEKIIFFPVRPDIEQLSQGAISGFSFDAKDGMLYYLDEDGHTIYKTDLSGDNLSEIGSLTAISSPLKGLKPSPDNKKILAYNQDRLEVISLNGQGNVVNLPANFVLSYRDRKINDIFWHSDSYHIIVVTSRNIEVLEARLRANPVNLTNLNKKSTPAFYDLNHDVLYFEDSQRSEDGKLYDNIYRLDLSTRFSPLKELIKLKGEINAKE